MIATCRERDFVGDLRLPLDRLVIQPLDPARVHGFVHAYLGDHPGQGSAGAEALFWHLAGGERVRAAWAGWQAAGLGMADFWGLAEPPAPPEQPQPWAARLWRRLPWVGRRLAVADAKRRSPYERLRRHEAARRAARDDPRSLLRLAENPYLLTMMVGLYLNHGLAALRDTRVALFHHFVTDLSAREDQRHRAANDGAGHPGRAGSDDALGALAWRLQRRAGGAEGVQLALPRAETTDLLTPDQLRFAQAASLLAVADQVRFTHQLLQEYFTAVGLRDGIRTGRLAAAALWPPESWWVRSGWEESAVLLAGLFAADCTPVIRWLRDAQPEVACQCLQASGARVADPAALERELHAAWMPRLTDSAREPAPAARAAIGRALGRLGLDDRPGVGLTAGKLPAIAWVQIPPGDCLYGEAKERRHTDGFLIARYPVTHAQFQAFLDDPGGYANDRWWAGLSEPDRRPAPTRWPIANHPRDTVNWFEAMAYCAWLSDRLGLTIRLPTEWEWERAARGTDGREYPWGDGYRAGYANINETLEWARVGPHYLERTSAVGIYPHGASPEGVLDLAGNVWEWCLNEYRDPQRIQPGGTGSRVVRGGSWDDPQHFARAPSRFDFGPHDRGDGLGFRVLCVSPIH